MKDIERKVYDFIVERSDNGFPPSIREICAELGIRSTSTAARYVDNLVGMGLLVKEDGRNRAICPASGKGIRVPLVGTITAGMPITAVEDITEYIAFNADRTYSGKLFALNVRGESMINAGILDGDIVIIEQCDTVENGTIAAVLVDGEDATIKRFYKENGAYRLQPENDSFEPIIVTDCSILGRVAAVIRYL